MLVVILSLLYQFLLCTLWGVGLCAAFSRVMGREKELPFIYYVTAGILGITVYVEWFSLFGKIGALAHMLMLLFAAVTAVWQRKKLAMLWREGKKVLFSWEGFFYVGTVLFLAFFVSRGEFHTDTNIYHAQMIRLYEEYGVIKGMGNLQQHFGYNSAYLAYASIFSMNWLFGEPVHATTGFFEAVFAVYSFYGLKRFKEHKYHMADMMRVGILFYILVILVRSMSPATDFATILLAMFVIAAWCENAEGGKEPERYAFLSVVAVLVTTYKFSAGVLVLIVLYPAVCLLKGKRWKEICGYLLCGTCVLMPFLIRNFLISGWLLYPFNGIDLFDVEWKVPEPYLLVDSDQIKVWGRCLFDVAKVDWPIRDWLPIWWEAQERYAQMFMGGFLIGCGLLLVQFVHALASRRKIHWDIVILILAVFGSAFMWFVMAPFIRYGRAYLFAIPLIAMGLYMSESKKGLYSIVTGGMVFCIFVSLTPYLDNYITDGGVFIKQNLTEPYYITQKPYDVGNMESIEINGNQIYYDSTSDEVNSYYVYPSTCYYHMLERSTLLGDSIEEGFRAK